MEYPHRHYIEFLISKKLEPFEIAADCLAHRLLAPNEADYLEIRRSISVPHQWAATIDAAPREFKRWLNDTGLYDIWDPDRNMQDALIFLMSRQRRDFETLMLLHGDVDTVRSELLGTYSETQIPSKEALELYSYYFWDIGSMTKQGLFEYIEATSGDDQAKMAAYGGELVAAYATLGLRQKINTMDALDVSIQFWQMQVQLAMRSGQMLPGAQLAGLAAIQKTGFEALAMREELLKATEESNIRRDAALFKAKISPRVVREIPSIDDIRGDVIDADESDEERKAGPEEGSGRRRLSGG